MTPATTHTLAHTSLGELTLVARDDALAGLYFDEHWHLPAASTYGGRVELHDTGAPGARVFQQTVEELEEYLGGSRETFTVPLVTGGSEFQERIWQMLREIPFGETTTYGALAERVGNRKLARRVGQAVGWNPISVFIPCHRVLGSTGSLTGYAGGLERKERLLTVEGVLSAAP